MAFVSSYEIYLDWSDHFESAFHYTFSHCDIVKFEISRGFKSIRHFGYVLFVLLRRWWEKVSWWNSNMKQKVDEKWKKNNKNHQQQMHTNHQNYHHHRYPQSHVEAQRIQSNESRFEWLTYWMGLAQKSKKWKKKKEFIKHANWHSQRNSNRLNENDIHANWHRKVYSCTLVYTHSK